MSRSTRVTAPTEDTAPTLLALNPLLKVRRRAELLGLWEPCYSSKVILWGRWSVMIWDTSAFTTLTDSFGTRAMDGRG